MSPKRLFLLVAIGLAATAVGLLGGAAVAAPDELLVLTRHVGSRLAQSVGPLAVGVWQAITVAVAAAGDSIAQFARTPRTPRENAMLVSGAIAVLFGLAALVRSVQGASRARANRTPFSGVGFPRGGLSMAGVAPARRTGRRTTPKEVRALIERGSSLPQIARRTGLPVDALAMLLSASEPVGQQQR